MNTIFDIDEFLLHDKHTILCVIMYVCIYLCTELLFYFSSAASLKVKNINIKHIGIQTRHFFSDFVMRKQDTTSSL